MNADNIKGTLQKVGGRIEEAAGALTGDANLKDAGREDQLVGSAKDAWGNVKEAGEALVDRARAAKFDAEGKSEAAHVFEDEHSSVKPVI